MKTLTLLTALLGLLSFAAPPSARAADWVSYAGQTGPGHGKHIVFLTGDEEYRSEEGLPMLAKILAVRHGFTCTVLFAMDPTHHTINPVVSTNIPGMEALDSADLCVMELRWRELPDAQMKHFVDYVRAGEPVVALRTSTHAFNYAHSPQSAYAQWDWQSKPWPGGFGQQVLGETWVSHHGNHGKESTRALINEPCASNPILRGVNHIWCPSDVYTVKHLPADATVLLWGQVLSGMASTDPPLAGAKNDPMMPVAWTRTYTWDTGKPSRVFTTTMGAAVDLQNEDLRRLVVNACYWAVGLEQQIPAKTDVAYVGEYHPLWFGFGTFKPGVHPADLGLKP